jgi:hypothetical protein
MIAETLVQWGPTFWRQSGFFALVATLTPLQPPHIVVVVYMVLWGPFGVAGDVCVLEQETHI